MLDDNEQNDNKQVALHEAAHLVFNVLIRKTIADFPPPTYVKINTTPESKQQDDNSGSIDGSLFTHWGCEEANEQSISLENASSDIQIAQLSYSLVGYPAEQIYSQQKKQRVYCERYDTVERRKIKRLNGESDYNKALDIVQRGLLKVTPNCTQVSDNEAQVLDFVQDQVEKVLQNSAVEVAINYAADALLETNKIEGEKLTELLEEVAALVDEVDFFAILDLPAIEKKIEELRDSTKK